jgi:hypothetical protein
VVGKDEVRNVGAGDARENEGGRGCGRSRCVGVGDGLGLG